MTADEKIAREHAEALARFGEVVHQVGPDQWSAPTPCTDWSVRDLVNHLVGENLWAVELIGGKRLADVGGSLDGDLLGEDPVATWDQSRRRVEAVVAEPDALQRTVELSYGESPAASYVREMTADFVIHRWDLARAVGADATIPEQTARELYERMLPQADGLASSGLFGAPVEVPDDADVQTRLLALVGRRAE